MGGGEESTPPRSLKSLPSTQEAPSTPSYPEWSTPLQAYYGAGSAPPPFFPSPVASPPPHPYLWGGQHPMIPPYGTPLPYPALYPHGALYAHPGMATAQGVALTNADVEGKKAASGNVGLVSGKSVDSGKVASVSGNDGASQSGDSGSEASSDATNENFNQASSAAKKRSLNLSDETNAKSKSAAHGSHSASVPGKPVVPMPATSLNIGMDLWNASLAGATPAKTRPQLSGASTQVASATVVGHEGMLHDHQWIQDERELKRQRRKQSNRESARRSRLRKQAECEELQSKVENLTNENHLLREELHKLAEQCEKLTSENNSIMEELTRLYGPEAASILQDNNHNSVLDPTYGEGNGHLQDVSPLNNSSSSSDQNGSLDGEI